MWFNRASPQPETTTFVTNPVFDALPFQVSELTGNLDLRGTAIHEFEQASSLIREPARRLVTAMPHCDLIATPVTPLDNQM